MSKYYTTLKALRENNACEDRYDYLVSKIGNTRRRLGLDEILKYNGIEDAIWALCSVEFTKKYKRDWYNFKADCAEMVLNNYEKQYPGDDRLRKAIDVARNPKATDKERSAAESAAWSAAWSAARSAAWSAAMSAAKSAAMSAAESAAMSAAWSAAESVAMSAAMSAAKSAAMSAAESAAMSAAWSAARSAQEKLFKKYFC